MLADKGPPPPLEDSISSKNISFLDGSPIEYACIAHYLHCWGELCFAEAEMIMISLEKTMTV